MRAQELSVIDVGALLEKVEAAAPIDAVEVVAAELGRMVDATAVTLLIADFSGRAVVRLTAAELVPGARGHGVEQAGDPAPRGHSVPARAAHAATRRRGDRGRRPPPRAGHRP